MLRRRLALALIAFGLLANAGADYLLLLRNPEELEAQARQVLRTVLPGYSPSFGASTFNFATQRLVVTDVVFHERGDPTRRLLEVERLEVQASGFPPRALLLTLVRPKVVVRIDAEGRLNLPQPAGGGDGGPGALPFELAIALREGRVLVDYRYQGLDQWLLIDEITIPEDEPLTVTRDLAVRGGAALGLGVLVGPEHRLFSGSQEVARLPEHLAARRLRPLTRRLTATIDRTPGLPLQVDAGGTVTLESLIGELVPAPFDVIWTELNPLGGRVHARARIQQHEQHGVHVGVTLQPDRAGIKPAGFPVPITDVNAGRFEIAVAAAEHGLEFLGVHWEGLTAFVGEPSPERDLDRPQLVSRGSVYPGRDDEGISMFIYAEVNDLPLSRELVAAFPPDIREVYHQFDPQGTIPRAFVTIFKGPFEHDALVLEGGDELPGRILAENPLGVTIRDSYGRTHTVPHARIVKVRRNDEPQLSILVPEMGGAISARYAGDPAAGREGVDVRLNNVRGAFQLQEGANVTIRAEGDLDVGGTARVRAQVMQGDLISVDVWGQDVPISEQVAAALPGETRAVAEAFHLEGGAFDFHVRVEKPGLDRPAQPRIRLDLDRVAFRHDAFPLPLLAESGRVDILPVFETREQDDPDRIEVELDLALSGEGVVAATVSGSLVLPPEQPPDDLVFSGDLGVRAEAVDLAALPPRGQELLAEVGPPTGVAEGVRARVHGPRTFRVSGRGRDLRAVPARVPYPVLVERFAVELTEEAVLLHDVQARCEAGGALAITGRVGLPPRGTPEGAGDEVPAALRVVADGLPLGPELVAALPPQVREPLERLRPRGPVAGALEVQMAPGQAARATGALTLRGVEVHLDRIVPDVVVRRDGTRLEGTLLERTAAAVTLRLPSGETTRTPSAAVAEVLPNALASLAGTPAQELRGEVRLEPERITLTGLRGRFAGAAASAEGELGLDAGAHLALRARLERLEVDARARELAGPIAAPFFEKFDVSGPADLTFTVRRAAGDPQTAVELLAEPRGMTAYGALVPVPVTNLTGRARLVGGDPVELALEGELAPPGVPWEPILLGPKPRLRIERRAADEARFPAGGAAGRVFAVRLDGLRRPDDPALQAAFEQRLPPAWKSMLSAFRPEGALDVEAFVYQPHDERSALRWVAEVGLEGFAFTAGALRYEELTGRLWAQGRLAEFELGACDGELRLERLDLREQTFTELAGPFSVEQGVLRLGRLGAPVVATLYEGEFRGIVEYAFESGRYGGWLSLGGEGARAAELGPFMRELDELSEEAQQIARNREALARWRRELAALEEAALAKDAKRAEYLRQEIPRLEQEIARLERDQLSGSSRPYRGKLFASLDFTGGGPALLEGQTRPFNGRGVLTLTGSNLLDHPALRTLHTALNPFVTGSDSTDALPNFDLRFEATPSGLRIDELRLSGPALTVGTPGNGFLSYDGQIDVRLVLFNVQGAAQKFLQLVPGTGWRYRGSLTEGPEINTLPGWYELEEGLDWIQELFTSGGRRRRD